MNRRRALAGVAGVAAYGVGAAHAGQAEFPVPGAIKLVLGKEVTLGQRSSPVGVGGGNLHIMSIDKGTFRLDNESRLTAALKGAVTQYAKVEYRLSAAVFDAAGKLLGTASHKEAVRYIRLGAIPTVLRDIELDFGISKAFKNAAFVAVAISEIEAPTPG